MTSFLPGAIKLFKYYRSLAEKAMDQVDDSGFFWHENEQSNSIANIVRHVSGNMLSRFTDFLTSDGEKPWRNRDEEFNEGMETRSELMMQWNRGWDQLLNTLEGLKETDLSRIVYIRNEGHTVLDAVTRQLAHYPYHVGQIVYIAKMYRGEGWQSLSIPRGESSLYNEKKFSAERGTRHFTDNV